MLRSFIPVLCLGTSACSLIDSHGLSIDYTMQPQEFAQDFGTAMGSLPDVDCSGGASVCTQVMPPAGLTADCDSSSQRCIVTDDVRLVQEVDLSKENLPSAVTNSSLVQAVQVKSVAYMTNMNSLSFATPPIDLYVGSQSAQTETDPGVAKLGTMPSIPAGQTTSGNIDLTDAGRTELGTLARDYKTPFHVLLVAHVVAHSGDPMPAGKIDLVVRPTISFQILPGK